jgi:hypothetical protein
VDHILFSKDPKERRLTMRRFALLLTGVGVLTIALGFTGAQAQKKEGLKQKSEVLKAIAAPLPSSLDDLFPPRD